VKDPLDNGRTQEIPFPPETILPPVEDAPEPMFKSTLSPEQIEAAGKALRDRSFSARNPHLGKMVNCAGCGRRHRATDSVIREIVNDDGTISKVTLMFPKCQQKFTNVKNGFEYFRESAVEGKDGKPEIALVPDLRTAIDPELKPTIRQTIGSPIRRNFAKPRYNPHPTTSELQLIERTRKVFAEMGFTITKGDQAKKNMEQARTEARRQLRREAEKRVRKIQKLKKLLARNSARRSS